MSHMESVCQPLSFACPMSDNIAGWGVPFFWAAIWACISGVWAKKAMVKERHLWEEDAKLEKDASSSAPELDEPAKPDSTDTPRREPEP
jgi:hypothetical protein